MSDNTVLNSFFHKSAAVWFGSLNTLLTLPVEKDCVREGETSRSRSETGDIILLNEIKGLSKMPLVAMSFVLQKSL